MHISVTDPIGRAMDRTKKILFKPFDLGKWFVMGFCAFLSTLGEGGFGAQIGNPFPGPGGGRGTGGLGTKSFTDWVEINIDWIVLVVGVGLTLIAAWAALQSWLSSRGTFMFIDGIVRNRAAVVEPWHRFRTLGNSLFGFTLLLSLGWFAIGLLAAGLALWVAWPDLSADRFGPSLVLGIVVGIGLSIAAAIGIGIFLFLLRHFVAPAMYLRGVGVMDGWRIVRDEVLPGRLGTCFVYFLMNVVIGIVTAMIAMFAICGTCCIGALPYLSSVLLLPLLVFSRAYNLHFLEQFGPGWRIFIHDEGPPTCSRCGYSLIGNVSGICPECGTPIPPPAPQPMPPSPMPPPVPPTWPSA